MNPQLPNVEDPYQYNLDMERERTEMNARMRMLEAENRELREEIKALKVEAITQNEVEGGLLFNDLSKGVRFLDRFPDTRKENEHG